MEIRTFTPKDVDAIAAIYNYHILNTTVVFETQPFDAEKMQAMLTEIASSYPFIIADDGGQLVGFAYVHAWKTKKAYDKTVESTLYIREDMKGRGIGSFLLQELLLQCRQRGLHAVIACITQENEESIRFHEKHGFQKVSHFRQVGRKFDRWLDVYDYELLLT